MAQSERTPSIKHTAASAGGPPTAMIVLFAILIAATTMFAHWPALTATAVSFDDQQYLIENYVVQNPGWASAKRFLTEVIRPSTVGGYYQPLAMISLMMDCAMGGSPGHLRPFHRTSLALHVANAILVYLLLYSIFRKPLPAALTALIFGVHPMTVETIPWIGERKTVLATFFALGSLIFYVRYVRSARPHGKPSSLARAAYVACGLFYILSLMSKPTTTALPLVMLLMDFWPLDRLSRRSIIEKIPFLVISIVSAIITYLSQALTAAVQVPGDYSLWHAPLKVCHNIVFYLHKMIWPVNLTSHYPIPKPLNLTDSSILAGVIGTCILIPLLLLSLKKTRCLLTGWLMFFLAIFPTMGVIGFTIVIASDKYAYLPCVGLLLVLAYALTHLMDKGIAGFPPRGCTLAIIVLCAGIAALEVRATRAYLQVWQDSESLHKHMIALAPNAPTPRFGLGFHYAMLNRYKDAADEFQRAVQLGQTDADVYTNLGAAMLSLDKADEALRYFREAEKQKNHAPAALQNNIGQALFTLKKYDEAIVHFQNALKIKDDYPKALHNMGNTLLSQNKVAESIPYFRRALELKPDYTEARNRLADALAGAGRTEEALDHYLIANKDPAAAYNNLAAELIRQNKVDEALTHLNKAIAINPNLPNAHYNLGFICFLRRQLPQAIEHYKTTVRIKPDFAEAQNNLGILLMGQMQFDEAAKHLNEALKIRPEYPDAHLGLARVLAQQNKLNEAVEQYAATVRLQPDSTGALNELAWILSTQTVNKPPSLNPVELAERLCELTSYKQADALDTLAAAYASAGRYNDAEKTAIKALEAAVAAGKQDSAVEIQKRIQLYQAGKPFRDE